MGRAIADYYKTKTADRLRVFSPMFEEDEIPLPTLFRTYEDMPEIEQKALDMATGRILDVGAASGCHSLVLQERGLEVTAIDISPLSVETMRRRGIKRVYEQDLNYLLLEARSCVIPLIYPMCLRLRKGLLSIREQTLITGNRASRCNTRILSVNLSPGFILMQRP